MTHVCCHILCFPAPRFLLGLPLLPQRFLILDTYLQILLVFQKPFFIVYPLGGSLGSLHTSVTVAFSGLDHILHPPPRGLITLRVFM